MGTYTSKQIKVFMACHVLGLKYAARDGYGMHLLLVEPIWDKEDECWDNPEPGSMWLMANIEELWPLFPGEDDMFIAIPEVR